MNVSTSGKSSAGLQTVKYNKTSPRSFLQVGRSLATRKPSFTSVHSEILSPTTANARRMHQDNKLCKPLQGADHEEAYAEESDTMSCVVGDDDQLWTGRENDDDPRGPEPLISQEHHVKE